MDSSRKQPKLLPVFATRHHGSSQQESPIPIQPSFSSDQKRKATPAQSTRDTARRWNSTLDNSSAVKPTLARVYVAVGSNLGNRFENIDNAIKQLGSGSDGYAIINLLHTSMLHETPPMYVTDQPSFLNGVIEIETNLSPTELLHQLKAVEAQLGRDLESGIRNGPRPVDLDILFYRSLDDNKHWDHTVMDTPDLVIPHPRISEREFVLAPLCEVAGLTHHQQPQDEQNGIHDSEPGELIHPLSSQSVSEMLTILLDQTTPSSDSNDDEPERVVVMPLPRNRFLNLSNETVIMGILNVTPDSFSDGGKWTESMDAAVQHALQMEQEGATIIDIGGESTRPGAAEVAIDEELARTIPIIQAIRHKSDIPISIDTRHSKVAQAAIEAGADIVNDVSGGTFDPDMLSTVASLGVPIVLMHMRGIPETMQTFVDQYSEKGVVQDVITALNQRCDAAEAAGIPRWMQIVDPGIGFAKDLEGNLSLLRHLNSLRANMRMGKSTPILLGTSRKGFIGKLSHVTKAEGRDFGTVASCVAALCLGNDDNTIGQSQRVCNIIRVHNVKAMKEAALIMDAIVRAK
ncbi:Folic acid synthesis protein FOL1 [Seminavis robusta]|uniref:Folic acid synthesis protein FOL1 n=1 Tax=Seminavis robusta TaxID=568900 RepID=A0A9N8DXM9_9STRA|nr:Folic acid synthesis protein FOL1 [Seminavis robusta]|eukprot:Sro358_g125780.1 Folic acid synthesis protein FOL1 (574) ;mRNA; r:12590-14390